MILMVDRCAVTPKCWFRYTHHTYQIPVIHIACGFCRKDEFATGKGRGCTFFYKRSGILNSTLRGILRTWRQGSSVFPSQSKPALAPHSFEQRFPFLSV
jgi:hypothetical protein